ncbi:MAG: winged helix-turn-helix domain-containing protein [Burkholderiaceae bacterium]
MIQIQRPRELARLRRVALAAQGLLQAQPYGSGLKGARNAVSHLGYVQIDTISVVERAHHHVLHTRVPSFQPEMVNTMLRARDIFEYWSHAAAFLPIEDFRFSLPYKQDIKSGRARMNRSPDKKLMKALLARIRTEGPVRSRDLESDSRKRSGWWDWKPAKKALEQLYMQGDLMVSDREGFQKAYDLTERVLPSHVSTKVPGIAEFAAHLIDQQLRCHGFVSLKGLTYLRRSAELRQAVKTQIDERLADGSLEQIQVNGGEVFLIEAGALERTLPRVNNRLMILSPFDNAVIQRDRLNAVFQFDYQIECYVPEAKRQYGYFSLPLLFRDEFVGRMDCKAHRKRRHLEIKALHLEPRGFDDTLLITAFGEAVARFSRFQGCDSVSVKRCTPKKLGAPIRRELEVAFA